MARRTYDPNKKLPLPSAARLPERRIPKSATLYDINPAAGLLTQQYGKGFSPASLRRFIKSGEWQQGWHYVRRGRIIKIHIEAIQEWMVSGH